MLTCAQKSAMLQKSKKKNCAMIKSEKASEADVKSDTLKLSSTEGDESKYTEDSKIGIDFPTPVKLHQSDAFLKSPAAEKTKKAGLLDCFFFRNLKKAEKVVEDSEAECKDCNCGELRFDVLQELQNTKTPLKDFEAGDLEEGIARETSPVSQTIKSEASKQPEATNLKVTSGVENASAVQLEEKTAKPPVITDLHAKVDAENCSPKLQNSKLQRKSTKHMEIPNRGNITVCEFKLRGRRVLQKTKQETVYNRPKSAESNFKTGESKFSVPQKLPKADSKKFIIKSCENLSVVDCGVLSQKSEEVEISSNGPGAGLKIKYGSFPLFRKIQKIASKKSKIPYTNLNVIELRYSMCQKLDETKIKSKGAKVVDVEMKARSDKSADVEKLQRKNSEVCEHEELLLNVKIPMYKQLKTETETEVKVSKVSDIKMNDSVPKSAMFNKTDSAISEFPYEMFNNHDSKRSMRQKSLHQARNGRGVTKMSINLITSVSNKFRVKTSTSYGASDENFDDNDKKQLISEILDKDASEDPDEAKKFKAKKRFSINKLKKFFSRSSNGSKGDQQKRDVLDEINYYYLPRLELLMSRHDKNYKPFY